MEGGKTIWHATGELLKYCRHTTRGRATGQTQTVGEMSFCRRGQSWRAKAEAKAALPFASVTMGDPLPRSRTLARASRVVLECESSTAGTLALLPYAELGNGWFPDGPLVGPDRVFQPQA